MRRLVTLFAVLTLPVLSTAACGSAAAGPDIQVTGAFGKKADVKIPKESPGTELVVKTLSRGTGPEVAQGDLVVAHFVGHAWNGTQSRLAGSSFSQGTPASFNMASTGVVPGIAKGLTGQKTGSRVLLVVPPKEGYGQQAREFGLQDNDTLVFVFDLLGRHPANAVAQGTPTASGAVGVRVSPASAGQPPTVTIPGEAAPAKLVSQTLIQGTGPASRAGQLLVVHYQGINWRTRKVFDSSWAKKAPAAFAIGVGTVVKGWDKGLVGLPVGSRALLVVPPAYGYGKKGMPKAGIKSDDTLVFVVDVLGAY